VRFRRVLLVAPSYPGNFFGGVRPPVGLGYIEEYLQANGVTTLAHDMNLGGGVRRLAKRIRDHRPELVGFTMMTYQYKSTYRVIEELKRTFPEVMFIVGGPHVSALEGKVLGECAAIDYAVAGEGEVPMRELCQGTLVDRIAGLYYRRRGEIRCGGPRVFLDDLDQLPFPRYRSYPLSRYTNEIEISTSRGCPHACIFCSVPNHMGKPIRYRSAKLVCEELAYFYDRGVRSFQINDDNLLAHRRRVAELFDAIAERRFEGAVLRAGQGIRADLLNEPVLRAMKRAGFRQLGIGVESGSDRVLATICKHLTVEQVDRAVKLACDLGFEVTLLFVVGTPGETLADVERSIDLANRHPVMKAHFFNLVPFPGTTLGEWVERNGALLGPYEEMFNRTDEWKLRAPPFFETKEMPEADRVRAQIMTSRASRAIQVRTLERRLARFGALGKLAAQAGRFNALERAFVGFRPLRNVLDKVMFSAPAGE
jgi:anaerobic magnesium-protoporphyrin IX monomethyl ester cyclase